MSPTKPQIQKQLDECRTKKAEQASELADANTRVSELETDVDQAKAIIDALKAQLADCQASHNPPPPPPPPPQTWRPYGSNSLFNTPVPPVPALDPNSAALVAQLKADKGTTGFSADDYWSHPVYFAKDSDPEYTITLTENWGTTTQGMKFRMPITARAERGDDGHLGVVTPDGWEYSFWRANIDHADHRVTASFGGRTRIDGDGSKGYATALGYGGAAGNITGEEMAKGEIAHALFAVSSHTNGQRMNGAWSQGSTASGAYPANGQRFYLEPPINVTGMAPWAVTVVKCLSKYGLIIGDTGGGFFKAESPLPYTTIGKPVPLLAVKSDGRFSPIPIPWDRMRALA